MGTEFGYLSSGVHWHITKYMVVDLQRACHESPLKYPITSFLLAATRFPCYVTNEAVWKALRVARDGISPKKVLKIFSSASFRREN